MVYVLLSCRRPRSPLCRSAVLVLIALILAGAAVVTVGVASADVAEQSVIYIPLFWGDGAGPLQPTPPVIGVPPSTATATPAPTVDLAEIRAQVVAHVNAARAVAGCKPVVAYEILTGATQAWSDQMASSGQLAHSPMGWYQQYGYTSPRLGPGEVVASGQRTPDEVVQAWLNSPAHRRTLLDCPYADYVYEAGVGLNGYRWTMAIGMVAPSTETPTPTATVTSSPTATATVTATPTATATATPTATATVTVTPTATKTATPTASATPTPTLTPTAEPPVDLPSLRQQVLARINEARRAAGCPLAVEYAPLTSGAQAWSQHMAAMGASGYSPMGWYQHYGYTSPRLGPGEAVESGPQTPDEVVQAWLNTPSHRKILLDCPYTTYHYEAGIGMSASRWTFALGMVAP